MKLALGFVLCLIGLLVWEAVGLFILDALNVISLNVRWPI